MGHGGATAATPILGFTHCAASSVLVLSASINRFAFSIISYRFIMGSSRVLFLFSEGGGGNQMRGFSLGVSGSLGGGMGGGRVISRFGGIGGQGSTLGSW